MANDTYTITLTEDQLQSLELVLMEAERHAALDVHPVDHDWLNTIYAVRTILYIQTRKYQS